MEIFGWIMLIVLAALALGMVAIFTVPFIVVELKALTYKIKVGFEDRKKDIDKKSEERQHRDEVKRAKVFELKNKKLDAKLQKLDKQIKLLDEKQAVAKELRKSAKKEKEVLNQTAIERVEEQTRVIPEENKIEE